MFSFHDNIHIKHFNIKNKKTFLILKMAYKNKIAFCMFIDKTRPANNYQYFNNNTKLCQTLNRYLIVLSYKRWYYNLNSIIMNYWMCDIVKLVTFTLGEYQSNCYILYKNYRAMIIDPGYSSALVEDFLLNNGLILESIYITHGHFDHLGGVNTLKRKYPSITVYAPRKDAYWYMRDPKNKIYEDIMIDKYVTEKDFINFQGKIFKIIETPGHTYGSTCLYGNNVLFSGDTLFYHSVGRTDLYLGDSKALYESIINKLFLLPDDTIVFPGHGRPTTILEEKINNPLVRKEKR